MEDGIAYRLLRLEQRLTSYEQLHYHLEGIENLLSIDAAETGQAPGTLLRLEGEDVPAFLSAHFSPHEIGVPDMLFAAKLEDVYPRNVVLLGVQPASLELGLELAPVARGRSFCMARAPSRAFFIGAFR